MFINCRLSWLPADKLTATPLFPSHLNDHPTHIQLFTDCWMRATYDSWKLLRSPNPALPLFLWGLLHSGSPNVILSPDARFGPSHPADAIFTQIRPSAAGMPWYECVAWYIHPKTGCDPVCSIRSTAVISNFLLQQPYVQALSSPLITITWLH